MRAVLLTLTLLFTSLSAFSQKSIRWSDLDRVEFEEFFDRDRNEWALRGVFSEEVQALNNVEIEITGYVIPLDVSGDVYVLSAFAFSSCFFCGGAGPETVMGMHFTETPPRLKTDEVIKVKGILKLHSDPGLEFHYMLEDAEIIERY